jgi:hypothetical protein
MVSSVSFNNFQTDNCIQFANRAGDCRAFPLLFDRICSKHGIEQTQSPLDQWTGRAHEPDTQIGKGLSITTTHPSAAL